MNVPTLSALPAAEESLLPLAMPEEPVLPLSVEGYHALLKAGVIQDGDPVELLEGFLVPKSTKGPRHAATKRRLLRLLAPLIPASCFLDSQEAMTSSDSEPEPDLYVIRGKEANFETRHPGPGEVQLVAEIADSSLQRDRNVKKRIYARAKVAVYWVVNLVDDCVEVFAQPKGTTAKPIFGRAAVYQHGDEIPVVIDGREVGRIAVTEILRESKK